MRSIIGTTRKSRMISRSFKVIFILSPLILSAILDLRLVNILADHSSEYSKFFKIFFLVSFLANSFKPHYGSYYLSKIIVQKSLSLQYVSFSLPIYLFSFLFAHFFVGAPATSVVVIILIQLFTDGIGSVFKKINSVSTLNILLILFYAFVVYLSFLSDNTIFLVLSLPLISGLCYFYYFHFFKNVPSGFKISSQEMKFTLPNFFVYNIGSKGLGEFSQYLVLLFYGTKELAFIRLLIRFYGLLAIPYEQIRSIMSVNMKSESIFMNSRQYIWNLSFLFTFSTLLVFTPIFDYLLSKVLPEFSDFHSLLTSSIVALNISCFIVFVVGKNFYIYRRYISLPTLSLVNFSSALVGIAIFSLLIWIVRSFSVSGFLLFQYLCIFLVCSLFIQDIIEYAILFVKYKVIRLSRL